MPHPEFIAHPLIIPTVVIPLTALMAGLSALATLLAGLFGFQLHAEGPKKLLEVMLKPRVLFSALLLNLALLGGIAGYRYWKNSPLMLWRITSTQEKWALPSDQDFAAPAEAPQQVPFALPPGKIELTWAHKLPKGSFRGAVASGSSIFIGADDGVVYELDSNSGKQLRRFFVGTAVSPPPLIHQGHLFVGEGSHDTHHARVYKFDLRTGRLAGAIGTVGHVEGELAASRTPDSSKIFAPSGKGGLLAFDANTLTLLWQVNDGHIDAGVLVRNDRVFAGTGLEKENPRSKKGGAFAYDSATGKKLWERELPASSWMQPISWKDQVCFVFGEVYFPSNLGGVYCFRETDGQPGVAFNNAAPIAATPILLNDDLVVADFHGKICRVSLENGKARWCRDTGVVKASFGNPAVDPQTGALIFVSRSEGLFMIHPETGAVLAQWKAEGEKDPWAKTYAPVTATRDSWFTVDMNGLVRKLRWKANEPTKLSKKSRPKGLVGIPTNGPNAKVASSAR